MTTTNTAAASGAARMTNAEIDAIVYACRQAGDDSTYTVVRAALAAAPAQPVAPITCKSEQKRLATLWGFVPSAPALAGEYPELPEPNSFCTYRDSHEYDVFDADQMRAYADATCAARGAAQAAPAAVEAPLDIDEILDALSRHDDPCEDVADALHRVRTLVKELDRLTRAENAWIDRMSHIDSTATGAK